MALKTQSPAQSDDPHHPTEALRRGTQAAVPAWRKLLGALLLVALVPMASAVAVFGAAANSSAAAGGNIHSAPLPISKASEVSATAWAVPASRTTTVPPVTAPSPTESVPQATVVATPAEHGGPGSYGCDAAIAYLQAHADPKFRIACPGNALGHEAMTCLNVAGVCPNDAVIAIANPCPNAYMNESSNSWVIDGLSREPIDPFGAC